MTFPVRACVASIRLRNIAEWLQCCSSTQQQLEQQSAVRSCRGGGGVEGGKLGEEMAGEGVEKEGERERASSWSSVTSYYSI